MKLVATSDFRNVTGLEVADAIHPSHIHKGARFSIGGDLPIEKLGAEDRKLVAALNAAGRIVEVSQTESVKQIDAEVKAETARVAKLEKKVEAPK